MHMYVLNTSAELLWEMRSVMINFIIHNFEYRYMCIYKKNYMKRRFKIIFSFVDIITEDKDILMF